MILKRISARKVGIAVGALVCAGIAAYILWYGSAGKFPSFPPIPNEYVDLGQAFLHGQMSLLEKPDPRLAALSNPYDYEQRQNVPYHWDASYFHGKYYLYWGPAPALVAAAWQGVTGAPLPGPVLLSIAYLALLAVFFGILIRISGYFSGRAASLSLGLFALLGFMSLPLLYIMGSSHVYEAAILYGQLFLLAGLLAWSNYVVSRSISRSVWLLAAGLSWGLALASRYNLGLSVVVYLACALVWLGREAGLKGMWKRAALLCAPLALCLVGLGLYNFARFGNPLEVGVTYMLSIPDLGKNNFSLSYIPSNLYIYLNYPLHVGNTFPFLQPVHFHPSELPEWIDIPKTMNFGKMVLGLFPSVPGVWLSVLAIPPLILTISSAGRDSRPPADRAARNLHFAMIGLAAGAQFLFLLVYFDGAERFIVDLYPSLILLVAMLVWYMDEQLRSMAPLRLLMWLSAIGLTLWSIGIGFFASFGLDTVISRQFDPLLVARLAAFWNALYGALHSLLPALG